MLDLGAGGDVDRVAGAGPRDPQEVAVAVGGEVDGRGPGHAARVRGAEHHVEVGVDDRPARGGVVVHPDGRQDLGGRRRRPSSASWAELDGRRRLGEGVATRLGLGEGDDLADVLLAHQQRDEPVDAEREPGVRRRAEAEGVEEEPELGLGLLVADAEQREDRALHVAAVDPHRARAQLPPVEHQVVGLGAHASRSSGSSELSRPTSSGCGIVNGWWAGTGFLSSPRPSNRGKSTTHRNCRPPSVTGGRPSSRRSRPSRWRTVGRSSATISTRSPGSASSVGADAAGLVGGEELGDRAVEALLGDPHPHQALAAPPLDLVGQVVEAAAGELGPAGHPDALDARRLRRPGTRCARSTGVSSTSSSPKRMSGLSEPNRSCASSHVMLRDRRDLLAATRPRRRRRWPR